MPSPTKGRMPFTRLAEGIAFIFVLVVIMAAVFVWGLSSGKIERSGMHETTQLVAEEFQVDLTLPGELEETGGVMLARFQVPESQLSSLYEGKQVLVTVPELDNLEVYGTVSQIDDEPQAILDASSGGPTLTSGESRYEALVTLGYNPSDSKDGMEVVATVSVDELGEAFGIDKGSLGSDDYGTFVEVVDQSGSIKQYPVTVIGTADDGRYIIQGASLTSGLTICTDLS